MDAREREALGQWMARLAEGDRGAFTPVYAVLWPVLRTFCRRTLGDSDGDDAAQQALLSLFARAIEYDPRRDALSWAFGIAAWECRTVRRRAGRRLEQPLPARPDWIDPSRRADEELLGRELIESATELLGSLRPEDARTIRAALGIDFEGREGLAPTTFRKRLERALSRLRAAWRSRHGAL